MALSKEAEEILAKCRRTMEDARQQMEATEKFNKELNDEIAKGRRRASLLKNPLLTSIKPVTEKGESK